MENGAVFEGGFPNPSHDSARAFRAIMNVMARPGTIEQLGGGTAPAPLSVAACTLILTLCDPDTSIALRGAHDTPDVRQWITFHTGAPFVAPGSVDFVVGTWEALGSLSPYKIGTPEYPDRSATLIVERDDLVGSGATLTGPGIKEVAALNLPETGPFVANRRLFPLGVDCFFTAGAKVSAVPRSTIVKEAA